MAAHLEKVRPKPKSDELRAVEQTDEHLYLYFDDVVLFLRHGEARTVADAIDERLRRPLKPAGYVTQGSGF